MRERDEAAMALKGQIEAATPPDAQVRVIASAHRMDIEGPELVATTVRDYLAA